MRRDKNAPALYELIRDKPAGRSPMRPAPLPVSPASPPPRMPPAPRPVQEDDRPPSIFSPGRSIRLPVGYLMFAALFFAVVVVGAYVVGYNRRDNEERQRESRESATALDAVDPLAVQPPSGRSSVVSPPQNTLSPPTSRQPPAGTGERRTGQPTAQNPPQPQPTTRQASTTPAPVPTHTEPPRNPTTSQTGAASQPAPGSATKPSVQPQTSPKSPEKQPEPAPDTKPKGVVIVTGAKDDPRQVGLNYLIAATLSQEEAEAAAQFLVSRGLEVAVVRADNRGPTRWVVILEGLAAKDLGSQRARTLEQRLQDLGRIYRNELKGPTVFNDPWWKKHTVGPTTPPEEE